MESNRRGEGDVCTYMAEFPCFVDDVDCLERLFDGSGYVWGVEEVGLDLCWDAG
jgi:hypothetical protein